MADKKQPLPKPPNKAFGRRNNFEQPEEQGSLLADRMAAAAAEGKLEEFLKKEMPDNEYARNLAGMMMGMTGMAAGSGFSPAPADAGKERDSGLPAPEAAGEQEVPEEVRSAIAGGDIQGLMNLLRREHEKRNPGSAPAGPEEKTEATSSQQPPLPGPMPAIDREIIDSLVKIALDNSVTLDWIILRAIKLYVQEYGKTGRL